MSSNESFVYTACPGWGDHDYCVIKTIVKDGKIVRTEKAEYPNKFLGCSHICQKGLESCKQPYNEHRLLTPLKRVGERGSGQFEEISWDQALDEIAEKMLAIKEKYGPEGVAFWNFPAGPPPNNGLGTLLSSRLGNVWGGTDPMLAYGLDNGPQYAGMYLFNNQLGSLMMDIRIIEHSDLVIIWGGNPIENQQRVACSVVNAKDNGAKIIDIGLLFDATAGYADQFIPVRPGSDAALVLSMCKWLIDNEKIDREYLIGKTVAPHLVREDTGMFLRDAEGNYVAWDNATNAALSFGKGQDNLPETVALEGSFEVDGVACKPVFQLFIEHVAPFTTDECTRLTGVPADVFVKLCEEFAKAESPYIAAPLGIRYRNQGEIYRSFYLLGCLRGTIGKPNAGVITNVIGSSAPILFNNYAITRGTGFDENNMKHLRQKDFFPQVLSGKPYPIKGFIKCTGNPVHNCPNRGRWIETFNAMDLVVDIDIWLTDTGKLADYVLPDAMPFERKEIVDAANFGHVVLQEPAIEPMGQVKPMAWIISELAKRLGLGEYFNKSIDEWLEIKLQTDFPPVASIEPKVTLERLEKEKMIPVMWPEQLFDPMLGLRIPTETGRIEFYAERLVNQGVPFPSFLETLESPTADKKSAEYPYQFFSGRQRFFMQSMFTNDDLMIELSGKEPSARMNPLDAAREGIDDGDLVEVYNQRGHVIAPMRLDEAIPPGTVQVWFGWRQSQFVEGTYSELLVPLGSEETITDISNQWFEEACGVFGIEDMANNYGAAYAGGWDTIWDCACNVCKLEEKKGA
ncbi:MAG: molybdopterin-dependent oxidoreductase [Eggerthellaceae bacterium]|nr:molybdopterin-dependent oxidoreductase [Eggerthellaceae bacterium]